MEPQPDDEDGTTRRSAETALYRFTPHPYHSLDEDGTVVAVNDAWLDRLGYERDEVEGEWFGAFLADDERGEFEARFEELKVDGRLAGAEFVVRHADGDALTVVCDGRVEYDDDGEVARTHCQFQDITERVDAEQEIDRKARAIEAAPIGITISDPDQPDNPLTYVNDEFTRMTGYDAEEAVGRNCRFLQGAATEDDKVAELRAAIDAEEPVTTELRNYRADGTMFWNRVTVAPIRDDDGTVSNYVGFQKDVTERVQKEAQLSATNDELDAIIDAVPHPLYTLDVDDYSIQRANARSTVRQGETCYEITHDRDQPCHEGEGETCYEITHDRDQPCHEGEGETSPCPLQEVVESGEPTTVEHTHYDADGEERVHEVHAAPITDEDGRVTRMVESSIDITERVEYERRLREQRNDLEVLNQVVRHDIRNDLQLVLAYGDLLADGVADDEREYVETVLESAEHAVELTRTARDMADVMLTTSDDRRSVSLRSVLETELDDLRSTYSDAVIVTDGSIPATPVLANEMLDSVFRNLLKNAVQHNDADVPEVHVSTTEREDTVAVRVADNGPGIPDDRKNAIFGKGESGLDSQGTGVGLHLVRTLVENYGGDVWVADAADSDLSGTADLDGALFVVELPKAE